MNWLVFVVVVLFVLGIAALICWLIFTLQYNASEAKRWKDRVLALFARAHRLVHEEERALPRRKQDRKREERVLREDAFNAYLGDLSVEVLAEYPGIGPATLDKLRESGYKRLAGLVGARLRIHGLGPKRLADIDRAIRDLVRKAQSTFDAGACRQATALNRELEQLASKHQVLEARSQARARAAAEVIDRLRERARVAQHVNLWRWFRADDEAPLVPPTMLVEELPDLDAAVRDAEERAQRRTSAQRPRRAPEPELPEALSAEDRPPGTAAAAAPERKAASSEENHLLEMELTIQLAYGVARSDGPVTPAERAVIRDQVRQRFGSDRVLLTRAEAFCAHYEKSRIDLQSCIAAINRQLPAAQRAVLLALAGEVVAASSKRVAEARPFLARLGQQLGLEEEQAQQTVTALEARVRPEPEQPPANPSAPPREPTRPSREECLGLLEIDSATPLSADLVRRQWNSLSLRYSPDKVAALGPEFVTMAESKRAAIRQAAENLLKELGIEASLDAPPAPPPELRENKLLDDFMGGM